MSISKIYSGTTYDVPEQGEISWGPQVTSQLGALIDGLDGSTYLLAAGQVLPIVELAPAATFLGAATLTPTYAAHRISGNGGAVTLDTTTAIANGTKEGQILVLLGMSDTNTVTIPDGANTNMNGDVTLLASSAIRLIWDSTNSEWREISRNV